MIWLLLNLWWLFPAAIALAALVALVSGLGGPALLAIARRVPAPAYAVLGAAVALSLGSSWLVGVGEERCQQRQEAAEKRADAKAANVAKRAQGAAQKAGQRLAKEKQTNERIREVVRYVACDPLPDGVRDDVQRQVERARSRVPAD